MFFFTQVSLGRLVHRVSLAGQVHKAQLVELDGLVLLVPLEAPAGLDLRVQQEQLEQVDLKEEQEELVGLVHRVLRVDRVTLDSQDLRV